jgi:non-specific serine/threonine protein kinase/serine/threonine-protein kinase
MTEETLFAAALEKATPTERQAFLDQACGGDTSLRQRVEQLLAADQHSRGILEGRLDNEPEVIAEGPGDCIGPYKLKEQIGEGGFGLVFVAEQQQPVRRKVALKIIKPGMDTREVVARFEAERQALALMDHPNIARVFDAGATAGIGFRGSGLVEEGGEPLPAALQHPRPETRDPRPGSGRPFFVMELVRGVPITDYCDQHQLTPRERLELFVPLCQAVQHAHQKGIIHRDLKPSNVLVTLHDSKPVVKVIDFGVAKALNQQLTEHSVYTRFAQMIGTPAYMSPEQAEMSGLDVDTRSDIYSLGVMLYELLTGSTPLEKKRLATVGFDELRRIIREEEPEKPSTRLSHSKDTLISVAAQRKTEPAKLTRLIRGELDWIVMKALEKDRTRRYETANSMARDVQRYLADEPVEACPPSALYWLKKFVRRNRGPVLAASVGLLLLLGGMVGTTLGLIEAKHAHAEEMQARERERLRAEAETRERQRAEAAEAQAKTQEQEAKAALQVSDATTSFLLRDLLGQAGSKVQADRKFAPDPNLTIRAALDRAAAAVGDKFQDQPELEAAIRKTLGDAYLELGQYETAIVQLQRSASIRASRKHVDTVNALHSLALAYREARRTTEAIGLFEQVRDAQIEKLGPEHRHTLTTLNNLAAAYHDAGKTNEAIRQLELVRDAQIRTIGPEDPSTLATLSNLATLHLKTGRTVEAIGQLQQVLAAKTKVLGPEHPDRLFTLNNLATAHWQAKQLDQSIPMFEQVLKLYRTVHGDEHPNTLGVMANLGVNYRDADRMAEAIALLEQAHRDGQQYPMLSWVGGELLIAYQRAGKTAEGVALVKDGVTASRKLFLPGSPRLGVALAQSGHHLLRLKAWPDAEVVLRECLDIRMHQEPDDWSTFHTRSMLGEALFGQKRFAEAESLLLQGYEGIKQREAKMSANAKVRLTEALERLVQLYDAWGKPAEAARWRNELAAVKSLAEKH